MTIPANNSGNHVRSQHPGKLRPLIVLGTRPEAIKLCPVILECQRRSDQIDPIVCSTGQHREMLDQVLGYFGVKPDIDLGLMQPGQTLTGLTTACMTAMADVLAEYQPDCVVVQGDTATVMSASTVAFYHQVPVVHIEAGLRTGDLYAPWPEEFNRRVAGIVTELHCAPTKRSQAALLAEQVPEHQVRVTGNTVIDALLHTVRRERIDDANLRAKYPAALAESVVLVTGHRRENFGDGLDQICNAITRLAADFPETQFIYPVHLNPNVKGPVHQKLSGHDNIHLVAPADYPEFVWLMDQASIVLTDSGGVQEEAPSLGCSVLVTRTKTERPEAIKAGLAKLVGADCDQIVTNVSEAIQNRTTAPNRDDVDSPTSSDLIQSNPYGDGRASQRIVDWMLERWRGEAVQGP